MKLAHASQGGRGDRGVERLGFARTPIQPFGPADNFRHGVSGGAGEHWYGQEARADDAGGEEASFRSEEDQQVFHSTVITA